MNPRHIYLWALARIEDEPVAARALFLALVGALARYGINIDWDLVAAGIAVLGVPVVRSARRKVSPTRKAQAKIDAAYTAGARKKAKPAL